MTDTDFAAVLAQMWSAFAPLARSRVEVLETYLAAVGEGEPSPVLRADAAAAAHKLAGALGSYGRPGSPEAADLEALLRADGPVPVDRLTAHVTALRTAVDA